MRTLRIGALLTLSLALLAACGSGNGSGSGSQAAFCDIVEKARANPPTPEVGRPSAANLQKILKINDDLAANAPSSISADMNSIKNEYAKFASNPSSAFVSDPGKDPEFRAAVKRVDNYGRDVCKIPIPKFAGD